VSDKSYEEIFSEFEEITNHYNRRDQYFDILYDSISSTTIAKTPSSENFSVNTKKSGIVARTFSGIWKEVAIEEGSDISFIINKIPKLTKKGDAIAEFEGWELNKEIKPKIDPSNIPIEDKIKKVREIYEYIKNYDKRIINVQVKYMELLIERIFVNNEGCDYSIIAGEIGYEIFDLFDHELLEKTVKNSLEMLKAELPPSGRRTIILDPPMAGLIAQSARSTTHHR